MLVLQEEDFNIQIILVVFLTKLLAIYKLLFMKPFKLKNQIQKYSWGTKDYIPELLGITTTGENFAELWMGDHPRGSSLALINSETISLNEIIEKYFEEIMGEDSKRFGRHLPFLFKVLSAASPLSIQAHPDKSQAEAGFIAENTKGVSLDNYNRNYKDNNHKPEIICALTPFTAMCGFCESEVIERNFIKLNSPVFIKKFKKAFTGNKKNRIKIFFSKLMSLDKIELSSLISDALIWADSKASIEAELIKKFAKIYNSDPGILAPLFLNLYSLKPGEALYQGPGELHAYVEGTGIELMSNSDNVLRGGLTPKYVDIEELLKILNFNPSGKKIILSGEKFKGVFEYETPSDEFILRNLKIEKNNPVEINNRKSIEILICISGDAVFEFDDGFINISRGESLFVPASVNSYSLKGSAELYSAGIPRVNG